MKEELYSEIDDTQNLSEKYLGLSWSKLIIALTIVSAFGIYIGILLFGTNSLEVLLGLEEYESYLQKEVNSLKNENATLQKSYFELKELDGDSN